MVAGAPRYVAVIGDDQQGCRGTSEDHPPAPPMPLVAEQQPIPVEEEEEGTVTCDEDEEVDGAMSLARTVMAVGAMRAQSALKMKITIHPSRFRRLG